MMKNSAELKKISQYALADKWKTAMFAGLVASLLGAQTSTGSIKLNLNINLPSSEDILNAFFSDSPKSFIIISFIFLAVIVLYALIIFIISGTIQLGYSKFNLDIIDGNSVSVKQIFSQFNRFGSGFCLKLLISIYTALWSLIFIIPGIVKSYSYAMASYILCENPDMTANEAITESKTIMEGHKWQLFCLDCSFIGWAIVSIIPAIALAPLTYLGGGGILIWFIVSAVWAIGLGIYVIPYKEATHAAFYREITRPQMI